MRARKWKMWALIEPEQECWGFDVYHTRKEAMRIRCASEKLMRVEVREIKPRGRRRIFPNGNIVCIYRY